MFRQQRAEWLAKWFPVRLPASGVANSRRQRPARPRRKPVAFWYIVATVEGNRISGRVEALTKSEARAAIKRRHGLRTTSPHYVNGACVPGVIVNAAPARA